MISITNPLRIFVVRAQFAAFLRQASRPLKSVSIVAEKQLRRMTMPQTHTGMKFDSLFINMNVF